MTPRRARLFASVDRLGRGLRRRLTPAGSFVAAAMIAAAMFGVNTRLSLSYQLFGLAAAALAVALVTRLALRPRLEVSRHLPEFLSAEGSFQYTLTLHNCGPQRLVGLRIEDRLAERRVTAAAMAAQPDLAENPIDRAIGFRRWRLAAARGRGADIAPLLLPSLDPGAAMTLRLSGRTFGRGELRFADVIVAVPELLGLMRAVATLPLAATLPVLPRRYPVRAPQLGGTRRHQPGGVAFAGRVGDSEEFVGLRDYRPGDALRAIHWKSWAKTGKPVVREFQAQYFVRHALILDTFAPAGETFEAAVSLAASLIAGDDPVESLLDLVFVEDRAYCFTAGRGLGSRADLLRVLAAVVPGVGGFARLAQAVTARAPLSTGSILILQAWDDERRALVQHLQASGVPLETWLLGAQRDPDLPRVRRLQAAELAAGALA